jgi:hypothetical protein
VGILRKCATSILHQIFNKKIRLHEKSGQTSDKHDVILSGVDSSLYLLMGVENYNIMNPLTTASLARGLTYPLTQMHLTHWPPLAAMVLAT